MNDEMKNKSGKVKVMYVRSDDDSDKRTQNPRTGKVAGVRRLLVQTVAVAPPAMTETTAVMTANVMTASVTIANAMTVRGMTSHVITPPRGAPFLVPTATKRQKRPITAVSAVKALSTRKCCAVSVRKRPACMARTPARRCSRAVLNVSSAHGSSRA